MATKRTPPGKSKAATKTVPATMKRKATVAIKTKVSGKKTAAQAKTTKSKSVVTKKKSSKSVSVRMYNVGFGDAFLVTIPTSSGDKRILFDCGSIAKKIKTIEEVSNQIIADCTGESGIAAIDVIVATHRHKDHVSGFARPEWDEVAVKEVWMPWTEHPTDKAAKKIRQAQTKLTASLAAAFSGRIDLDKLALSENPPTRRLGTPMTLVLNAMSNAEAMNRLHHGFTGEPKRRFLPSIVKQNAGTTAEPGKKGLVERSFVTDVLPGVTIHILGPSRDENVIREMDPPKGKSYLRMRSEKDTAKRDLCRPFSEEFEFHENEMTRDYMAHLSLQDRSEIGRGTDYSDLEVAVALDSAVNGTSLMLMLEVAGTFLLFPGDAQWGTWNAAMTDVEWSEMLGKTNFYKVGHHCSHNATPKAFVENNIEEAITAMASTMERSMWPSIPRKPLLDALAHKRCKIARSDREGDVDSKTFTVLKDWYIETLISL